jgi:hypothetical protein
VRVEKVRSDFPLDFEVRYPPYLPRNRWRHIRNRHHHLGLLSSRIPGKDRLNQLGVSFVNDR